MVKRLSSCGVETIIVDITENNDFRVNVVSDLEPSSSGCVDDSLRELLAETGMLCLRMPRALTDEEFKSMAARFGPIKDPIALTRDGTRIRYAPMRQDLESGRVVADGEMGECSFGGLHADRPLLFETFHCDDTYTRKPGWASVLHARELPPSGGGPTCFIDMRAAYALLTRKTRETIDALRVVYHYNNEGAFESRQSSRGPNDVLEDVCHPLVRTHPIAGTRALFLDLDRAKHIVGLPKRRGRALLQSLQDHAEARAPACEHHWRPHDVLVWDNASVQHKARGNFKVGEARSFWRYLVAGDTPV